MPTDLFELTRSTAFYRISPRFYFGRSSGSAVLDCLTMATTENSGATDAGSHPDYYESAQDYVLDHLDSHEPQSPAELADEYECGADHMRTTLAELADSGDVERVSRGQYVLPDGEADTDAGKDMGSVGESTTLPDAETASTADLDQQEYTEDDGGDQREIAEDDAGTESSEAEIVDLEESSSSPSVFLPMDPMTLGMVLAVGLVLWLAYRTLGGGSDGSESAVSEAIEDVEEEAEDMAGGLVNGGEA